MVNSTSFRSAVAAAIVVILAASGVWAAQPAGPSTDGLLRSLPATTLFCVRINELDSALATANEFLKDVAPESFDAKAEVLSKLRKLIGNEELTGVDTKRNFVLFGVDIPTESPAPGPMGNMFIGALIPVGDYKSFISQSPNCSEPDDEGISTITADGQPKGLATSFRQFALLCPPGTRDKLLRVKELMGQTGETLGEALDTSEVRLAATSPVWLYLNVKQGSKLVGPMISGKLEQMKANLQKMKESGQGPMVDPSGIVNFYAGIFKVLIDGTEHIMVGLSPKLDLCNVTVGMKAVPETQMAAMLAGQAAGDFKNMLGYLDNGAMMNVACKIDHKSLNTAYMQLFELIGQMTTEGISEPDLEELKKLTTEAINAVGDSLAISFGVGGKEPSPFSIKYVIKVKDEKAFKEVIEKELQMTQEGALAELYKGFGMEIDVEVERDAGTYNEVKIDAAKVTFKMGDEESPQSQMLKKVWGDALDYRWAFVDGHCVYSIGSDADETVRELIDQVKAGGPQQIRSEMKAALDAIPNSSQADAVGTFNYVRMLNMASGIMRVPGSESSVQLEVPTESNIAFASRTTEGKMTLQMALPKKHLLEIKTAFETLIPQLEQQAKELQKQQSPEQSEDK